jgi:hypothetical protein
MCKIPQARFGMQYGVATCHLAFHGNMRDQALLECKRIVSLGKHMLKDAEKDLMSLLS